MNRRNLLMGLVAAVPLAVFGWSGWPTADAAPAKLSLGCGCCCEDPSCPPGCDESCPPDCILQCLADGACCEKDCCDDAGCPPGRGETCPADCKPEAVVAVKPAAKKQACGPNGCCAADCEAAAVSVVAKAENRPCPPCPLCP